MNPNRQLFSIVCGVLIFFGAPLLVNSLVAKSNDLEYEVVLSVKIKEPQPLLKLRIWLPNDEPSMENVLRLCSKLRNTYKREPRIEADVFSSKEGAKKFSDAEEFSGYTNFYSTWRARYHLARIEKKESLDFSEGPNEIGKKMKHIELLD